MSSKKKAPPVAAPPPAATATRAPPAPPAGLSSEDAQALLRWRLALGPEAEGAASEMGLGGLGAFAEASGLEGERLGDLDDALGFVYGTGSPLGGRSSRPNLPKWLGLIREFFREDVIALVQKDAIERKGLTQLLFEPETLPFLEKNVELVATLLSAKGLVPDAAKEMARENRPRGRRGAEEEARERDPHLHLRGRPTEHGQSAQDRP